MNFNKLALSLQILLIMLLLTTGARAEERNIYVGDLIELQISTRAFSQDELTEKFHEFEIVNIKEEESGYSVTLRTFEPGEKKVILGDKEIVIDVKSTLDEIDRESIFEGDMRPEDADTAISLKYLIFILPAALLLLGGYNLWTCWRKKNRVFLNPYQRFISEINKISLEDDDYFVKLTYYFKEYIESIYSCKIRGKTSLEIIDSLSGLSDLTPFLPDIQGWLQASDYYKYTRTRTTSEGKVESRKTLTDLVGKINETKEGEK